MTEVSVLRAASLTEPQASRIADGKLVVFTRPWRSPYRGMLAIHAMRDGWSGVIGVARLVAVVAESEVTWHGNVVDVAANGKTAVLPVAQLVRLIETEGPPHRWVYLTQGATRVDPVECPGKGGGIWTVPDPVAAVVCGSI